MELIDWVFPGRDQGLNQRGNTSKALFSEVKCGFATLTDTRRDPQAFMGRSSNCEPSGTGHEFVMKSSHPAQMSGPELREGIVPSGDPARNERFVESHGRAEVMVDRRRKGVVIEFERSGVAMPTGRNSQDGDVGISEMRPF